MNEADNETRMVLKWLEDHPMAMQVEKRGIVGQAIIECLVLIAFVFWGAVAAMVLGAPLLFLWFLVMFE